MDGWEELSDADTEEPASSNPKPRATSTDTSGTAPQAVPAQPHPTSHRTAEASPAPSQLAPEYSNPWSSHTTDLPPVTIATEERALFWADFYAAASADADGDFQLVNEEDVPAHREDYWTAARRRLENMTAEFSEGRLETSVGSPQRELPGTKDQFVSYLVTTDSDFQTFARPHFAVRRRFTDFVFLWKTLKDEYPQCAIPPLPDKHKMEYVRGDRFSPDFTSRRASSLHRFLKRLTLHPVLRRATLLLLFLESQEWNQHMKGRPGRGGQGTMGEGSAAQGGGGGGGIMDSVAESFLNTFTKPHKPDKRFLEVVDRATKLTDDLSSVEKVVMRVARRQSDLEADYSDLSTQVQKLCVLEPSVAGPLTSFSSSLSTTSKGLKQLRDHTDNNYLTSLRDMDAYIGALKTLLKTREAKQLDFEGLSDYLARSAAERDAVASSPHTSTTSASSFLRSKVEDLRGIDHEQARRERQRKLEMEIERLTSEVENAKKVSEAFDEHTVKEVVDFERIKALEFRDTLGELADAHIDFFRGTTETWEAFLRDMQREEEERKAQMGEQERGRQSEAAAA